MLYLVYSLCVYILLAYLVHLFLSVLDDLSLIAQVWHFLGHICYFFLAVKPHMKTPAYDDAIFVCVDMEIPSQEARLTATLSGRWEMRREMLMLCPVSACSSEVWAHFQYSLVNHFDQI